MSRIYAFWKPREELLQQPQTIFQLLYYGEEAEGVDDLPIHEIIAAIKVEFPKHEEKPGSLIVQGTVGHLEATWSWQHFRFQEHDLLESDLNQLFAIARQFGCGVYDSQANTWMPPVGS